MADCDRLDRAMCGDIWSGDSMDALLRALNDIGPRLTGSEGERKAQKYIAGQLRRWGLETGFQRFRADTWVRGESVLRLPALKLNLPCSAAVYSASTGGREKAYELVDVFEGTPGDFERNRRRIRGRAVLFSRKDYVEHAKPEAGWSRYKAALEAGAKAFVVGTYGSPGAISAQTLKYKDSKPGLAPAVAVNGETAERIRRAMKDGVVPIAMSVSCRNVRRYTGNVIGGIQGRRKGPALVLGAHIDSFDISPGADDNGSGVAVVCEVARLFAAHRVKPERPVRFVFFTGEELGRLGSEKYAGSVDPKDVAAYFNFDLPANGGYPGLFTMMGKSDPRFWLRMQDEAHYRFQVREIVSRASDHYSFYRHGIPCLWEIARNSGSRSPSSPHHTAYDTIEYVNSNELKEAATMAVKLALRLSTAARPPFERFEPVPDDQVPHFS